jgi:hypothetical protein
VARINCLVSKGDSIMPTILPELLDELTRLKDCQKRGEGCEDKNGGGGVRALGGLSALKII